MPTPPLSSALQSRLADATAWRFESQLGPVFTPRFFCCTNPNTMGISDGKEPVAVIELSPNPAFISSTVSYAGTLSYDPDGSITGYSWSFEGHTPSSGTATSGTLNYSGTGVYTIELTVTDGTGLESSPARIELEVVEADFAGYVGTSAGVFWSTESTWLAKNTGLSGNDLIVYGLAIDPRTRDSDVTIWRCGRGGIQVSNDGGDTWSEKNPASISNAWSDSPAPAISDLTFRQLLFVGARLFVLATWQNASSAWRSVIFYTDDAAGMRTSTAGAVTWTEI